MLELSKLIHLFLYPSSVYDLHKCQALFFLNQIKAHHPFPQTLLVHKEKSQHLYFSLEDPNLSFLHQIWYHPLPLYCSFCAKPTDRPSFFKHSKHAPRLGPWYSVWTALFQSNSYIKGPSLQVSLLEHSLLAILLNSKPSVQHHCTPCTSWPSLFFSITLTSIWYATFLHMYVLICLSLSASPRIQDSWDQRFCLGPRCLPSTKNGSWA